MTSDRDEGRPTRRLGHVAATTRTFAGSAAGSAAVLVAAILAALIWSNVGGSYESFWHIELSIRLGDAGISHDLRDWVNDGLMTLFFLLVGLEARREFDLGDLRDRRRFVLPLLAGIAGLAVPVGIYLLINAGGPGAHGWGVAMSTDTALALGLLSLVGRGVPEKMRVFLLTVFVVDDVTALLVIAVVYSDHIAFAPLLVAIAVFAVLLVAVRLHVRRPLVYAVLGVAMWGALLSSGVDPLVAGLAIGLSATAYNPKREHLERATGLFRLFREQPTAELARTAATGLTSTLSPNDRLQRIYAPWTDYLIVPLFAMANVGIAMDGGVLARSYTSAITLGIIAGYVIGKPVAVVGTSWLVARFSRGRIRPSVGWAAVTGSGTIAGIGFTVSLLIATLAFRGESLTDAKIGVLTAGALASVITWVGLRITARLPVELRGKLMLGEAEVLIDLISPVDTGRDHIRGPENASVTVVEYGDFQCPFCGQAEDVVREELKLDHDVRFVWRHLPLRDVHPQAQLAAEAAEAAAAQGAFWPMRDLLLSKQDDLRPVDLVRYAREQGLDHERFHDELIRHVHVDRVAEDVASADVSSVSGTPSFFINGQRHYGAFDVASLRTAVKLARRKAQVDRAQT